MVEVLVFAVGFVALLIGPLYLVWLGRESLRKFRRKGS